MNILQRNQDAQRTLTELCLVDLNESFDAHLQVKHCVSRAYAPLERVMIIMMMVTMAIMVVVDRVCALLGDGGVVAVVAM